jgi:hypothetical protein
MLLYHSAFLTCGTASRRTEASCCALDITPLPRFGFLFACASCQVVFSGVLMLRVLCSHAVTVRVCLQPELWRCMIH